MALFLEEYQVVGAIRPVDLQTGANDGDWISLKDASRLVVIFWSAIGTAGDDPTITMQQASDVSGTGAKALNIASSQAFKKQAATSLLSTGQFASASGDISTNTWTNTDSAEEETLVVLEFAADELDADNDFDCVRARVADVGSNAQLGMGLYLAQVRYPAAPANVLSIIAD